MTERSNIVSSYSKEVVKLKFSNGGDFFSVKC